MVTASSLIFTKMVWDLGMGLFSSLSTFCHHRAYLENIRLPCYRGIAYEHRRTRNHPGWPWLESVHDYFRDATRDFYRPQSKLTSFGKCHFHFCRLRRHAQAENRPSSDSPARLLPHCFSIHREASSYRQCICCFLSNSRCQGLKRRNNRFCPDAEAKSPINSRRSDAVSEHRQARRNPSSPYEW